LQHIGSAVKVKLTIAVFSIQFGYNIARAIATTLIMESMEFGTFKNNTRRVGIKTSAKSIVYQPIKTMPL
jgi:hypothetical protein